MAVRKFFVIEFIIYSAPFYFTDDFGPFGLTDDYTGAVQWDQGDDAVAFLVYLRSKYKYKFLKTAKVIPHGFN